MTIIDRIIAWYLSRDPIRARHIIRAAKIEQVRVAAKPTKRKPIIIENPVGRITE